LPTFFYCGNGFKIAYRYWKLERGARWSEEGKWAPAYTCVYNMAPFTFTYVNERFTCTDRQTDRQGQREWVRQHNRGAQVHIHSYWFPINLHWFHLRHLAGVLIGRPCAFCYSIGPVVRFDVCFANSIFVTSIRCWRDCVIQFFEYIRRRCSDSNSMDCYPGHSQITGCIWEAKDKPFKITTWPATVPVIITVARDRVIDSKDCYGVGQVNFDWI